MLEGSDADVGGDTDVVGIGSDTDVWVMHVVWVM
jgi:hypothetical protein